MFAASSHERQQRPAARASQLPLINSRRLKLMGLLVVVAVLMTVMGLAVIQYQQEIRHAHERHELMTRVLEDHTTRTLDSAALGLTGIAGLIAGGESPGSSAVTRAMQQNLVNLLQLRSLALVDTDGRVLQAVGDDGAGRVDLAALAPLPQTTQPTLGRVLAGRGLPRLETSDVAPAGLTTLPFLQRVARPDGTLFYLVALLNPDYFANVQVQTLNEARLAASLVQFDGQCVAATESAGVMPGDTLERLRPLASQMLDAGRSSWVGEGLGSGQRVVSFRALRSYPLWVMVEQDHRDLVEKALLEVLGVGSGSLVLALVVMLLTLLASRAQGAREAAQKALQQTQSRLAERGRELDGVFASVQELIFRTDAQGLVQFINARWTSTTGRPIADAIGKPLPMLFSPLSQPTLQSLLQADACEPVRQRQLLIEGPEGRLTRLNLTLVPMLDEDRLVGYAGSAVDVTELTESQAQLQAQLAFNASLIESSPLPVVVRDVHNVYLRVNRAWETFTGRTRGRVIGTLASLAYPPEHQQIHEAKDQELLQRGYGEIRYEAPMFRSDGRLRDIYVTKALISDAEGKPIAILAAFLDISEIREAERATRLARDAAEAASAAKTEFIANVSHELRTPLQAILGFSELGMRRSQAHVRLSTMFGDIHRAGHRMLTLVNDLLDMSKLDRKGIELEMRQQDLRPIVQETLQELEQLASARSVHLDVDLGSEPLVVRADALRLGQVVRNLLANAIRFTPALSSVEVRARLQAGTPGHEIEISVGDRGPGIPQDELESIFEAFVQSSKTKDGAGGTGLGLTISRRIIQGHGGRLWAANRADGGAVLTVVLPAVPASALIAGPPTAKTPSDSTVA